MNQHYLIAGVFLVMTASLISGCEQSDADADSRYDAGYSDGYAEGYNTACEIRATLVEGDWDDEHYTAGYEDGRAVGVADCKAGK